MDRKVLLLRDCFLPTLIHNTRSSWKKKISEQPIQPPTAAKPIQWQPLPTGSSRFEEESGNSPAKQKQLQITEAEPGFFKSKKVKSTRLNVKSGPIKKAKKLSTFEGLDESQLQETTILEAEDSACWALVAGPKQPPSNK